MPDRFGTRGNVTAAREEYDELPSTQDRAIALARGGAPEGTRVVARSQSRGRGRLDHGWSSPPGGLYLSVVLRPTPALSPLLPLAIGAGLADELARRWSVRPRLKWPNDLLCESPPERARKLSGILVDTVADRTGPAAVAGIGVNVARPPGGLPTGGPLAPVALDELVRPCPPLSDVEEAAASAALGAAAALGDPIGAARLLGRCRSLLYGVGRPATVDGVPRGRIATVADDGALVLDQDGERVEVRAGDVRVEGP